MPINRFCTGIEKPKMGETGLHSVGGSDTEAISLTPATLLVWSVRDRTDTLGAGTSNWEGDHSKFPVQGQLPAVKGQAAEYAPPGGVQ